MIEINNLTTGLIEEKFLKRVAEKILKSEKQEKKDLSIVFVGQGRIRELNKKYRGKNRETDILAFPDREFGLGEIVICLREVRKNAKRYNSTFQQELSRVLIHGILHLLGEDHEKSERAARKMSLKEQFYLSQIKI